MAKKNITPVVDDGIIDVDLSVTQKKKFRFNHDNSRIVELNVSDVGILTRISDALPKLEEHQRNANETIANLTFNSDDDFVQELDSLADSLRKIDAEMRELVDYIFNAPVSAVAAPDGSMYDPFDGTFRYDHILTMLLSQYETNLSDEFTKMGERIRQHTSKYGKA